jgi:hypothetical protein
VYNIMHQYTRHGMWPMRSNIEIDDVLMRQAQKASGHRNQETNCGGGTPIDDQNAAATFGRYRWRGNLARSRTGRGAR